LNVAKMKIKEIAMLRASYLGMNRFERSLDENGCSVEGMS
jgi:hypothetical protein